MDRSLAEIATEVCARSREVQVVEHDPARYLAYVDDLFGQPPQPSRALQRLRDEPDQAAFVLIRDCVNFGSGFHPELVKREGLSGARTIEAALLEHVLEQGNPDGQRLAHITPKQCADLFGQPRTGAPMELMTMFAVAWNEFGTLLCEQYDGEATALVEDAGDRADRMIELLGSLSCWWDVSRFEDLAVPFRKRARLAVWGLEVVAGMHGRRRFADLAEVPIFADNLIPHVLRVDGLLAFAPQLQARIDEGRLLEHGSPEEVAMRAGAVVVCARMAAAAATAGRPIVQLDMASRLWKRGQAPRYKQHPRPRSRSFAY